MALESLMKSVAFDNGVVFELKVDEDNKPYLTMRDGPLSGLLQAINLPELAIPTAVVDMQKLIRILGIGIQVYSATTPSP